MAIEDAPTMLGAILAREAEQRHWHRAQWYYVVINRWPDVVGEYLSRHTRLVSIDRDRVVIAVPAGVWAQEISYWQPQICERIATLTDGIVRRPQLRIEVWPQAFAGEENPAYTKRSEPGLGYRLSPPLAADTDLTELLERVRDKYLRAVEHWVQTGYARCAQCQSPTLNGYRLCSSCQYHMPTRT